MTKQGDPKMLTTAGGKKPTFDEHKSTRYTSIKTKFFASHQSHHP